jgi:hypothetical protein
MISPILDTPLDVLFSDFGLDIIFDIGTSVFFLDGFYGNVVLTPLKRLAGAYE